MTPTDISLRAPRPATTLDDLVTPRSVAIVGASDDPKRIGGRPLYYMLKLGFEGEIYPVNPKRETTQGVRCYPSVADLPSDVDFVLVAVPAAGVAEVVRQAAAKNAKTAMIFSSGFAEVGPNGQEMQDELAAIARSTGIRVIGPNCLGVFNAETKFFPTFTATIEQAQPQPGGISIASQSGAYGSHIYYIAHLRGLGIRYWATTGNEADVHVADIIGLLAENADVHTICAYAESIKDGDALRRALETARLNRKSVVFMKVGRSAVGAAAASSHTASLAGEDAVYDAVLREHGAYRAKSTEEMLDVAYAARPRIYPSGRRLGLVTISGGAGVLMADAASDVGVDVPPMPEDAQVALKEILPFAAPRNPVDVTAQFFNDLSLVPTFTKAMLDRGGYDGLVGFWTSVAGSPFLGEPLLAYLKETMADYPERLFVHSLVAPDEMRRRYEDAGFPCFEDPTRAVSAMAALMTIGQAFERARAPAPALPPPVTLPTTGLGEREAKAILARWGLPVVEDVLATDAAGAEAAATRFGATVAMKIASPDIAHKTDIGGVALGVAPVRAADAFERVMASARENAPDARVDGVLVSPMATDGVDCIVGAKIDPVFGPVVLFGLGGVYAEVLKDVACRPGPIGADAAKEMIEEISGVDLLKGARGDVTSDLDALAEAVSKLSVFAAAHADQLESVEMNPVRATPNGCLALDALIVTKRT